MIKWLKTKLANRRYRKLVAKLTGIKMRRAAMVKVCFPGAYVCNPELIVAADGGFVVGWDIRNTKG